MSESFENADCSFTFDTSLSAEFDLTIYAGIIYELAVVTPQRTKIKKEEFIPDLDSLDSEHESIEQDHVDMNQTHLTEEFNQIFSYFDEDIEEMNVGSDEELNQYYCDFKELSDEKIDERSNTENYKTQCKTERTLCKTDSVFKAKDDFLAVSDQRSNEIMSDDGQSNNGIYHKLSTELGVGNVKEKVQMYNEMLEKINENLESEKKFFREKLEDNVIKESNLKDPQKFDDVDKTIATISDFNMLSKYVKKLSSIESYSQIISRLNRLVNAISQLDKDRLNGMNLKSLKNFLFFIKIYSDECVYMSSAIRKDLDLDLEKNVLSPEDLLYCLDVVAKEVN